MFTGIIKNLGEVKTIVKTDFGLRLQVAADFPEDLSIGDSVAVNGACLTVVSKDALLSFDVIEETLLKTNIGDLNGGDIVNLEFSMRLNDFVGGHLISGHVDFVAHVLNIESNQYYFSLPSSFNKYVVEKGSITINGVSLTVNYVDNEKFRVDLIPETLEKTNLKNLVLSSNVNIEIDLIARYLEKLV